MGPWVSPLSLPPFGSGQWNGLGIGRCRGHLEDLVGKTRDKTQGMFGGLGPEMCMFCFVVFVVCCFLLFVECQMFWICMYREFMYIWIKYLKKCCIYFVWHTHCILHTTRKALSHLMWLNLFIPYHTWTDLASGPHTARNLWIAKFLILRHHQVLLLLIPVVFPFRQLGIINVSFQTMSLFTHHLNCKA